LGEEFILAGLAAKDESDLIATPVLDALGNRTSRCLLVSAQGVIGQEAMRVRDWVSQYAAKAADQGGFP
jgi:hypothetical protein